MLSEEQLRDYQNEGFAIAPGMLSADDVATLADAMTAAIGESTLGEHDRTRLEMEPEQAEDGTAVRRLYEPCEYYDAFRACAASDTILDCVEQLVGPNILLHYSKVNMKPASVGSVVEWHQDLCYFPQTNSDLVTVLIYLDNATIENGCLQVLPGRHREPPLDHTHDGYFQGRVTEDVDDSAAVSVEAPAGSVVFMHCLTPHSSAPNTSGEQRRTFIVGYRAADAFPIHLGLTTAETENFVHLVRGQESSTARYTLQEFPLPRYKRDFTSLYDLQAQSREGM